MEHCSTHAGRTRGSVIEHIKDTFTVDKVNRGMLFALAEGLCPVPFDRGDVSIEGETTAASEDAWNKNAAVRGITSISNALPQTGVTSKQKNFKYTELDRLRMYGLNGR